MKKFFALILALCLVLSCTAALAEEPLTIAISMRSTASEYHMQYVAGAELFAATLPEGTAVVQALPCEGNDDKQVNDINALIASTEGNMILYVDANNSPNIVPIAEACEEAGVYWCAGWNTPEGVYPTSGYHYWVNFQSCDAVRQGYDIAVTLFNAMPTPGKGKICVLEGMLANSANADRMKGLQQALEEYPDIEVLDDQAGDWATDKALSITENWLAKYGDEIEGIWCACDDMAVGVVQALKAKDLDGKILTTGVDGTSAGIELVENGQAACTIANNGWLQGFYACAYAYAAKTGKINVDEMDTLHRCFLTNGFLVSADTLADYKATFVDSQPQYDPEDLDYPIAGPMFPEA